ncbi:hypothetical protein ABFS82_12G016900 [Erythranthe guttata]|uniref:Uncharacterized protein n=1 Tax=Erythranthe guttata TaxID=4155 RepID=A0A022R1S5_ERYGU|nr:PREDICTED: uncharacterized protein LOC105961092 [Erythranthe guttata]XP_012840785.1 PREDICTED: uncharacterized protein LOC105961092 [Erythranthe guttata]EYU34562.1 hypothetical protein MIMGU_mgv1a015016mg [Erythranthe guttata]|eukprot:XP_012840784.1 PREDICTED: uncharacterized protein LOC105961092 [Erythranthe guttata]
MASSDSDDTMRSSSTGSNETFIPDTDMEQSAENVEGVVPGDSVTIVPKSLHSDDTIVPETVFESSGSAEPVNSNATVPAETEVILDSPNTLRAQPTHPPQHAVPYVMDDVGDVKVVLKSLKEKCDVITSQQKETQDDVATMRGQLANLLRDSTSQNDKLDKLLKILDRDN